MLSMKIAPSLAAGNCLIIKSSEKAPLTSLFLARLSIQAGIPPGVLNVLSGFGYPCGAALSSHLSIRKIAFTGSVATGKLVQKAATESNLKACTLELGGKSPLVVFEDADLGKAAKAAAASIVFNSGQVCMASSRVYVHETVKERFVEMYVKTVKELSSKVGDPLEEDTTYGPVADRAQYCNIQSCLQAAREQKLDFVLGGGHGAEEPTGKQKGCFVQPTVLRDVPEDNDILRKEIFGYVRPCFPRSSIPPFPSLPMHL